MQSLFLDLAFILPLLLLNLKRDVVDLDHNGMKEGQWAGSWERG